MVTLKTPRVLIVDDESTLRTSLFRLLDRKQLQVVTANKIQDAQMLCQSESVFDLAIVDLNLPDGDGLDLMAYLKSTNPEIEVIVLTGYGTIETAIKATQRGAFHFITKPFDLEELLGLVDKALSHKKLLQENNQLRSELHRQYKFDQIIGKSDAIQNVLSIVERVCDSDSTVLVHGESGTGKELVARAVHYNSHRSKNPFVAINCGAIPAELLESELFGHAKGAFTGAIANRIGKFEQADGGTLFLDEIGDLHPSLQVKILRALQERCFEPVGSTKTVHVNVRVIAATNINLEEAVSQGRFREDLFYRLNVIPILIPSLRERRADIPLLLSHFLKLFSKNRVKFLTAVSPRALESLMSYNWPGNIRELENFIERMSVLKGQGVLEYEDLPSKYQFKADQTYSMSQNIHIPVEGIDFNTLVDQFENSLILQALQKTKWNRNQAAQALRLNRTTLVEKMKKKGLKAPPEFNDEPSSSNSAIQTSHQHPREL